MDGNNCQHREQDCIEEPSHEALRRRIFAVSGSSQLIPALAAAEQVARGRSATAPVRDFLVLYGLNGPYHGPSFAQAIEHLAHRLNVWEKILYLRKPELRTLSWNPRAKASAAMHSRLTCDAADELYLSCVPHPCSDLLSLAYPMAETICHGDGFGVNFSAGYFYSPGRGLFARTGLLRTFGRALRRKLLGHSHVRMDRHCLLLPNLFDASAPNVERVDKTTCLRLLDRLAVSLDDIVGRRTDLEFALQAASQVVVCLTGNFAEARRMTLEAECSAYREFLSSFGPNPSALLVVKPHPRGSAEQMGRLRSILRKDWPNLIFLSERPLCYVPFEVVFLRYFASDAELCRKTQLASFTTAALALEHLCDTRCAIGFGDALVRRWFHRAWTQARLGHERDLNEAVRQLSIESAQHRAHARRCDSGKWSGVGSGAGSELE